MNKVFLIGNLTRDPELTETANGVSVCHFTIAVKRNYTTCDGERETDFFNCTAWRGVADSVARFCKKGSKVAVSGSIQIRNYEDNNGQKKTAVDIIAHDVEFLTPRSTSEEGDDLAARRERIGNSIDSYENRKSGAKKPTQQRIATFDDDGDIPF